MFIAWVVFHVIVCVALILVVLLQSSKGEGLAGSAFGGGGGMSGAVFGGRGAASFLSKATSTLAVVFMLNCGALAFMSADRDSAAADPSQTTESAVTQQAQRDMEEAMQRQQQQQQLAQPVDSTGTPVEGIDLLQQEAPAETPAQPDEGSGN
ncbi:MAG: preprotein translocase subunit SecG [bacterium]